MSEAPNGGLPKYDTGDGTTLPLAATFFAFLILVLSAAAMTFDASARDTNPAIDRESAAQAATRIPHPAIVTNALTGSRVKIRRHL